jgi:2-oxoisovalerate dehydrogenase E1 component
MKSPTLVSNTVATSADRRRLIRQALPARLVEEKLLDLFSQGRLHGTVHTCIGQEMSGVVLDSLRPGDTVFSNHRCHGHFLFRTGDIEGLIAELMGRTTGVCGGIGGSQHLYKDGFFSNGIQGGIVPVAAGLALAHKLKGHKGISVVFIGDGTLGEGAVYEAFNIASKWSLPLLVVLEDNKYSQSTAQEETLAGGICARAQAFGIRTETLNTWHWEDLHRCAASMISSMRNDSQPRFLHVETFRLKAHSKGDDLRSRELIEPYERRDPLSIFLGNLTDEDAHWVDALHQRIAAAVEKAANAPQAAIREIDARDFRRVWKSAQLPDNSRFVSALNETFIRLMNENPNIFFFGEDVLSPYGGAFKASRDLSELFPNRVRNTPISESCIVGIGSGLGLSGYFPIVEIMFGDFVGLAFDQIVNHAAKFQQMYNKQVACNLIVRTPMGGGRGYGPTHSQTLDKHFVGVPGLRVVSLNSLTNPAQLYDPLMGVDSGPTLVIENKLLYGSYLRSKPPVGFELLHSNDKFPMAWLRPDSENIDVTILGYGGSADLIVDACETLFEEHDIVAQGLCLAQIYPFKVDSISEIIRLATRIVIVEEGQGFAGFASEVIAQMSECGLLKERQVHRLMPAEHCIPASGPLEKSMLPSIQGLIALVIGTIVP